MQSHWVNSAPYYRCRFPAEYALANQVDHPLNVNLREDAIVGHVDQWLALEFAPHRLTQTIRDLAAAQQPGTTRDAHDHEEAARKIAECARKLAQYRAALDAGASPATVATWIAETEAEKASYALAMRRTATRRPRMTEAEIKAIVDKFADIAAVLHDADPDDKAEVFRQLGLRLTYHPGRQLVEAEVEIPQHWQSDSVRGGTRSPLVVVHPRTGDLSPVQANTARAGRARISQAKRGGSTGPPDRSGHVTCGNDEGGEPGSGRTQGRTVAAAARRLIIRW